VWVYKESNGSYDSVCSLGTGAGSYQFEVGNASDLVQWEDNSGTVVSSTTTLNLNQWYHIAVSRDSSNNIRLYVNGTKEDQAVRAEDYNDAGPFEIARNRGATQEYHGYIRDLRIVVGDPVYTADTITVPDEPLTAIANTNLLACHLPYIADGSTNNWSYDLYGTPSTKPFSPYDYDEYSATDHGGTVYFNGTGDRLETSAGKIPSGSTNFTVSCWFYSTRSSDDETAAVFGQGAGSGGRVGIFLYGGTNTPIKYSVDSGDTDTGVFALRNVWYFVELQVTSSTAKMFINGVEESSKSLSGYSAPNTDLTIGNLGSSWSNGLDWTGYISDFLVQTGTPSGSSTVPTSSRSSSGSELHIKSTDASIIDKSQSSNLKLVGNTTGSTTQAKFGGSKSMYFDGTGDYISAPTNKLFGFSTKDFTVEFWVYFDDVNNARTIYSNLSSASGLQPHLYVYQGAIRYYTAVGDRIVSSSVSTGQWYHVALSRSSSSTKLFINGTQSGSTYSDSNDYGLSQPLGIGTYWDSGSPVTSQNLNGYMQDLRVTKGLARYTSSFTPPTASLEG